MCECEKKCQKKYCQKECICVTDMRYGMNDKKKPSSNIKDGSEKAEAQCKSLLSALGIQFPKK